MVNWTDPIIHWNQLGSSQIKRLIDTWGKDEKFIAAYDKKNGIKHEPLKVAAPVAKTPAKTAKAAPAKKTAARPAVRQKHTGADGEVKFLAHRNLYVGFFGGKVVVTKRTAEQCLAVLRNEYKLEIA
jgi:hypothetical protein